MISIRIIITNHEFMTVFYQDINLVIVHCLMCTLYTQYKKLGLLLLSGKVNIMN